MYPRLSHDDLFDVIIDTFPFLTGEYMGGGIDALVFTGTTATVVISDDWEILIGVYPGDAWQTAGDTDDLSAIPADDIPTLLAAISAAIERAN